MQGRCGVQRGEDGRTKGINLGEKGLAESRSLCRDQESSGASDVPSFFVEVNDLSAFTD